MYARFEEALVHLAGIVAAVNILRKLAVAPAEACGDGDARTRKFLLVEYVSEVVHEMESDELVGDELVGTHCVEGVVDVEPRVGSRCVVKFAVARISADISARENQVGVADLPYDEMLVDSQDSMVILIWNKLRV